jgi:uncharacterized membrane protein
MTIALAPADDRPSRLDMLDAARGVIMVLMALDHTRTFLTNATFNPTDLARTYPALFLTRWSSQYCTPFFLFLAGAGIFFAAKRRRPIDSVRWLLARGLVLVILEMTLVRWGWYFNMDYRHTSLQILWAIGVSMWLMTPLVFLPPIAVGAVGFAVVVFHNAAGPWLGQAFGMNNMVWLLLYERGATLQITDNIAVAVNFPVLPLFGLMAIGYAAAPVFRAAPPRRRTILVTAGVIATLAFVALRTFNFYGDPRHWELQSDWVRSVMSFFSLTKHPLSLQMTLATVGPGLVGLGLVAFRSAWWQPLIVIGRAPLFFYLTHVPVIHGLACVIAWACFDGPAWLMTSPFDRGSAVPPQDWGFGLPGVYAWTLLVVTVLYGPSRWYARLKANSQAGWLNYL